MSGAQFFLNHPLPVGAYSNLDIGVAGGGESDEQHDHRPAVSYAMAPRGQRRQRDAEDGGATDDTGEENRIQYRPCKDVEETYMELGPPGPRHKCFGCKYVGQNRAAKIPDSRLQEVFQLMTEGIGVSWPSALAVEVGALYAKLQKEINSTRLPHEDPLPDWTPASILDHWYNHTLDPEIIKWLDASHIRYSMNRIRSTGMERVNLDTGEEYVDKEQLQMWCTLQRQFYFVSSKDPRKMSYYFEGAMIDHRSVANGGLARVGRPVFDFVKKGSKRQRSAGAGFDLH